MSNDPSGNGPERIESDNPQRTDQNSVPDEIEDQRSSPGETGSVDDLPAGIKEELEENPTQAYEDHVANEGQQNQAEGDQRAAAGTPGSGGGISSQEDLDEVNERQQQREEQNPAQQAQQQAQQPAGNDGDDEEEPDPPGDDIPSMTSREAGFKSTDEDGNDEWTWGTHSDPDDLRTSFTYKGMNVTFEEPVDDQEIENAFDHIDQQNDDEQEMMRKLRKAAALLITKKPSLSEEIWDNDEMMSPLDRRRIGGRAFQFINGDDFIAG